MRGTEFDLAVDGDGVTYLVVRHGAVEISTGQRREPAGRLPARPSRSTPPVFRPSRASPRSRRSAPCPARSPRWIWRSPHALAGAASVDSLDDLSVLAKARSLRNGTRPELGRSGKPDGSLKDKKGDKKGPL